MVLERRWKGFARRTVTKESDSVTKSNIKSNATSKSESKGESKSKSTIARGRAAV